MLGRVKSRQIKTGGFAISSHRISPFNFILLLCCVSLFLLVGCESQEMKAAKAERARKLPAEARKANLLQSLDSRFENPAAHYELAQIYHAEGLWSKAEYHYNIALSFDPSNADAQVAMVKLFLDSGDTAKSKISAETYVNQAANSDIQSLRLGTAFQKQQLDEYALACFQQALKLSPSSALINKQVGYYYLNKGDKDQGKEYLVRSFQLDPSQSDVAGELGRLGVEVKIPQKVGVTAKTSGETKPPEEKKLKMVMRHGRVQFEPTDQKSE